MRPTNEPASPDTNRAPHPGFARIPANRASALASNACVRGRASAVVVRWGVDDVAWSMRESTWGPAYETGGGKSAQREKTKEIRWGGTFARQHLIYYYV